MFLHFILLLFYFKSVYSDCPDDSWIRRSGTGWCYKPFEGRDVSWNQAQSSCNKYGADLVSFEDQIEMEWVYNILNWNQEQFIQYSADQLSTAPSVLVELKVLKLNRRDHHRGDIIGMV